MSDAERLCQHLRLTRGFAHKRDISDVMDEFTQVLLPNAMDQSVPVGDDCAAIPDGHGGYLLFAIEGMVEDFIERQPWFAGYSAVMVNVSDIYAMGGRPIAVVNALWSEGMAHASEMIKGMAAASAAYAVPIVGGHSNNRSARPQLAVSILGKATHLLTSFDAMPGDVLIMACDLRGAYQEPFPYWNCSSQAPGERLRADLDVLPQLAEDGLCRAAKDISMAGAVGTLMMLLECSGVGAHIDVDAMPKPEGVPLDHWLTSFPSYGFVLSVNADNKDEVLSRFNERDIACAVVGQVSQAKQVVVSHAGSSAELWNFETTAFIRASKTIAALKP